MKSETMKSAEQRKLKNNIIRNEESFPEIFGLTEVEILEIFEAIYEYHTESNNPSSYKDWCKMYSGIHKEGTGESAQRNWLACVRWLKTSGKLQEYANQAAQQRESGESVEEAARYEAQDLGGDALAYFMTGFKCGAGWQSKQDVSNWISVGQDLPKDGKMVDYCINVLCLLDNGMQYVYSFVKHTDTKGKFYFSYGTMFTEVTDMVTHWQPLPPNP